MLCLDNLPRTVSLRRCDQGELELAYVDTQALPRQLILKTSSDWRVVIDAIQALSVRGAPAIGIAGAAAIAIWACNEGVLLAGSDGRPASRDAYETLLATVSEKVATARPTAVSLSWAVSRLRQCALERLHAGDSLSQIADHLYDAVKRMEAQDEADNRAMGLYGADLLEHGTRVLTHCNAGSLATSFYGTALGVVYAAAELGKIDMVYVDETRPVCQGSRITAWELSRAGVPATLICDNMAASLMGSGDVDVVLVGADRIAANGDVANKIGTYSLAVLASYHGIPLYVVAPTSTIDFSLSSGDLIPIELRDGAEVADGSIPGLRIHNPAFDVTPANLITGIVTEQGVFDPSHLSPPLLP